AGPREGGRAAHGPCRGVAIRRTRRARAGAESAGGRTHARAKAGRRAAAVVTANRTLTESPHLDRGLGLLQATSANILVMIGIGPFLTIPFMLQTMGGPHILYAWLAGAVLALCDGLVYAQLGAALPGSGGPYVYLREAYKPLRLGPLMGFLFIFQVMLVAPLSIASGAVGFADYLRFYWPSMSPAVHDAVAGAVAAGMTALLYRSIRDVGRLSVIMLAVVAVTVGWVVVAGLWHVSFARAFTFPPSARTFDRDLLARIGAVALL